MGTKLSKGNSSAGSAAPPAPQGEDKSATLPPATNNEAETTLTAKSETLPRSGFERTTGLGKSFRKSMRKLVGKKKVKEEEAEKKESKAEEEKSESVETKDEEKGDFKTVQQQARAEFFKEMYTDKEEGEVTTTTTAETEAKEEEEDPVNVSLIGTPVAESEQETGPSPTEEESKEPAERNTATNENLAKQQLDQESSNQGEKSLDDEIKKHDDDVNNGPANETEQSEEKGEDDNEVNELEETEIAPVTLEDVTETETQGNGEEMATAQEEVISEDSDAEKSNDDEEEEKSTETFDENLIGSGSESLESKSDDLNSEEGSEEGVTTDEGIVESEDDNAGSEENFETVKSKQKDIIEDEREAAVETVE